MSVERQIATRSIRVGESLLRRLDRASFDPRMLGDSLRYLDSEVVSDLLVCWLPTLGVITDPFTRTLQTAPYRSISPTLFGFEEERRHRWALPLEDHLILIQEVIREVAAQGQPRFVIVAGFSSAGDLALRLAAAAGPEPPARIDGCLALGCNLALETCVVTRTLAEVRSTSDADLLGMLRASSGATDELDDWLNVADYMIRLVRQFRADIAPLRAFAEGIVHPFRAGPLQAFIGWYREATSRGRCLRCVFEDNEAFRRLVRDLQLKNLDEGILGDRYEEESIVIEPGTGHFDLAHPARLERHLEELVARLRRGG